MHRTDALAVKLSSPGPVFYRDRRIGLGEQEFGMFKFRSMYVDSNLRQAALEASNDQTAARRAYAGSMRFGIAVPITTPVPIGLSSQPGPPSARS